MKITYNKKARSKRSGFINSGLDPSRPTVAQDDVNPSIPKNAESLKQKSASFEADLKNRIWIRTE